MAAETLMPGIYRRSDSPFWWIWFLEDGRRIMRSSRTKSKTQAYAELNSVLLRLKRGERVAKSPQATNLQHDLLRRLSDQEASGNKAPSTAKKDYIRLKAFFAYCEQHDIRCLDDIDARTLQHFLAWLPEADNRISPVTANRYVDAVRGLLPTRIRVVKNRENESIGREIPQELFQQILDQADPTFRAFLILLAETGLRTGHLAMVETSWIKQLQPPVGARSPRPIFVIDFPPNRINTHKRAPQLPLSPLAVQVISKIPPACHSRDQRSRFCREGGNPGCPQRSAGPINSRGLFLFESPNGAPLYTSARVFELWRQIRNRLGHNYRPHDIRHTFAIRELLRTGNPAYVQRMLGHSTPMMTMKIYQQLSLLRMTDLVAGANPSGIKKLP